MAKMTLVNSKRTGLWTATSVYKPALICTKLDIRQE